MRSFRAALALPSLAKIPRYAGDNVGVLEPLELKTTVVDGNLPEAVLGVQQEDTCATNDNMVDVCLVLPLKIVPDPPICGGQTP